MSVTPYQKPNMFALGGNVTDASPLAASDDTYVTSSIAANKAFTATGFRYGLAVPVNATINGVDVTFEFHTGVAGWTNGVTLLGSTSDGNVVSGYSQNMSTGTKSTTADQALVYGGPTNLWGATNLIPRVVNDAAFAFTTSFTNAGSSNDVLYLDWLPMRVYYTAPTAYAYVGTRKNGRYLGSSTMPYAGTLTAFAQPASRG